MKLNNIAETALYVRDITEAQKFYTEVLGMETIDMTPGRDLFLRCGNSVLILFNPEQTKKDGGVVPTHGSIGQGHVAFGIPESDFAPWTAQLAKYGIAIEKTVDWGDCIHSIYFRDPSNNSLEFISENCYR